ncbi:MAG: RrF2 family transcriptional regulator [Ignavibacteria bacterium]
MQLTLAGEYAIRTMIHLAENEDKELITIKEIAELQNIPEKFLRKIIPQLCNAGLIKSYKGVNGGISFVKSPDKITPYDIIQAVEGPLALNKCLIDKEFCSNTRWCSVHTLWCDTQALMRQKLSSKSIKELALESISRRNLLKQKINN